MKRMRNRLFRIRRTIMKNASKIVRKCARTSRSRRVQPNQSAAPSRAPRPSAPSVELPSPAVTRKTRQTPTPEAAQPVGAVRQTEQNVLERYVKATEEARQSIHSLSDAEQEALQRLQKSGMKEPQPGFLPSSATVESLSLKKFPAPPLLPESGCSLSGNPWETQSLTKRFLQRRIKHGLSSRIMFLQPSCCPLLFILPCLKR